MEELNKYSTTMLNIEELGQGEDGIPVEVYATPRAEQTTTAGVEPKAHETMSDLREPSVCSRTVAAREPDKQKATELGSAIASQQLVELITIGSLQKKETVRSLAQRKRSP